jgi:transcriptional regulator with XRE-family HTH domain
MATRETPAAVGRRAGLAIKRHVLSEIRAARMAAGVSQRAIARTLGWTQTEYWRFENDLVAGDIVKLSQAAAVCGLELTASIYPKGEPLRDRGQLKLIARFRSMLAATWHVRIEAPFPMLGDLRSWDVLIRLGSVYRVGVEAETRVRDIQELVRRIRQRELHGGVNEILVILSDSAHNRRIVGQLREALGERYTTSPQVLRDVLRIGTLLPGSGVILL